LNLEKTNAAKSPIHAQARARRKIKALLWRFAAGMTENASRNTQDQLVEAAVSVLMRIEPNGWLNEREVAARYPFTVQWLRRARWEGVGPCYHRTQSGVRQSRVYYATADIEDYLATCRVEPKTPESPSQDGRFSFWQ